MKLSIATFKQAHTTNYTKGRTAPIDRITIHHTVGMETSLAPLWQNPARNASSHFFVHPNYIEQYVDTNDTAWTNSSTFSNTRAITIEVRGDWRTHFDQKTLDQLTKLLTELRKNYPSAKLTYHDDEKRLYGTGSTECPAKLKTAGYAQACWNQATANLAPKVPLQVNLTYEKITPKKIVLKNAANLWNFSFTTWAEAKAVQSFPAGSVIDVVAVATNQLGAKYYMTAYSYNNGNVRATNGFNIADAKDFVEPTPLPEAPAPTPPVTNPNKPSDFDVIDQRLDGIDKLLKLITDFLDKTFNKWRT